MPRGDEERSGEVERRGEVGATVETSERKEVSRALKGLLLIEDLGEARGESTEPK